MKAVNKNRVAIEPLPIEQAGELKMAEQERDKEIKKQNRGYVILMGPECNPWIKTGDLVSFYRDAATPVEDEDGRELQIVHEDHVLAKF
jgi:co-chaperonin GroES (HSP10)